MGVVMIPVMRKKLLLPIYSGGDFDKNEAAVFQMRANLMSDLRRYIEKRRLTQAQAAKQLGVAQSRVSDLVRGKWDKFSLKMLITLEARIGRKVRVEFAA
jgi:predicted XRE-type DNA-binding protein